MAAGDIITSEGYIFTPEDVQLFASSLVEKIQSTAKDPEQYELVTVLDDTISSLPVFKKTGNAIKLVRILMTAFKGEKGDAFTYADFTPEQLQALALTFEKLTPEQVNTLKIKLADLSPADIASLQKPATDAAAEVREKMDVITGEANTLKTDLRQLEATVEEQEEKRETSYTQWQAAEQGRQNDEIKRKEEFGQIKTDADTATGLAIVAAKKAEDTNTVVENAEKIRQENEVKRVEQYEAEKIAEQAREEAEEIRVTQEAQREKDTAKIIEETNTAKLETIEATTHAQSVSDHPGYIGSDYHVYTWDYTTGAYKKTDTILRPEGFSVYRTYASISAMNADLANVPEGKFVLINTNDVEQPDNAKLYVRGAASFEYLVDMSGAIGFTGKTPGFTIGTVTEGDAMAVTISENGTDSDGNPLYKLNFVLRRGPRGFTPIIETGTITTGLPGTQASVEIVSNGQAEDGREKYLLNLTIPRGNPGTGNVTALGTGLLAGKMYLFMPGANNSTEGRFIEYVVPDNFPEAPEDGKTYGRKDGEWSEVNSAGNMDGGTAFSVYGGALVMDGGNAND